MAARRGRIARESPYFELKGVKNCGASNLNVFEVTTPARSPAHHCENNQEKQPDKSYNDRNLNCEQQKTDERNQLPQQSYDEQNHRQNTAPPTECSNKR